MFFLKDIEKKRGFLITLAYFATLLAIAFMAYKYAFGVCFPILFAFVVASILQKPKNFIVKKTFIKKGFASTVCVMALIVLFLAVMSLIGVRTVTEIRSFIDYIVLQFQSIDSVINNIEDFVLSFVSRFPEFISETLSESTATLFTQIREFVAGRSSEIPDKISGGLESFSLSWIAAPLTGVISTAKQIPSLLIAVVVTIVLCCFMTADYDMILDFFRYQLPKEKRKDLTRATVLLKSSLGKMAKAYLLIMFITFVEVSLGFYVLKLLGLFNSGYIIILAIVISIIDVIPVLGTGTVLLPWTAYSLIVGDYGLAIGLGIMYATITVIRQIIEPKLVAGQLGLPPFMTLIAMFLGLKIFGVLGVFILPIFIIMLKLLNDEEIIHLWKSPSKVKAMEDEETKTETAEDKTEE